MGVNGLQPGSGCSAADNVDRTLWEKRCPVSIPIFSLNIAVGTSMALQTPYRMYSSPSTNIRSEDWGAWITSR